MKPREYFINGFTAKQHSDGDVIIYEGKGPMNADFWHVHLYRPMTRRTARELVNTYQWKKALTIPGFTDTVERRDSNG